MRKLNYIMSLLLAMTCLLNVNALAFTGEKVVSVEKADFTGRVKRIKIKRKRVGSSFRVVMNTQNGGDAITHLQIAVAALSKENTRVKFYNYTAKLTSLNSENKEAIFEAVTNDLPEEFVGTTVQVNVQFLNIDNKEIENAESFEVFVKPYEYEQPVITQLSIKDDRKGNSSLKVKLKLSTELAKSLNKSSYLLLDFGDEPKNDSKEFAIYGKQKLFLSNYEEVLEEINSGSFNRRNIIFDFIFLGPIEIREIVIRTTVNSQNLFNPGINYTNSIDAVIELNKIVLFVSGNEEIVGNSNAKTPVSYKHFVSGFSQPVLTSSIQIKELNSGKYKTTLKVKADEDVFAKVIPSKLNIKQPYSGILPVAYAAILDRVIPGNNGVNTYVFSSELEGKEIGITSFATKDSNKLNERKSSTSQVTSLEKEGNFSATIVGEGNESLINVATIGLQKELVSDLTYIPHHVRKSRHKRKRYKSKSGTLTINIYVSGNDKIVNDDGTLAIDAIAAHLEPVNGGEGESPIDLTLKLTGNKGNVYSFQTTTSDSFLDLAYNVQVDLNGYLISGIQIQPEELDLPIADLIANKGMNGVLSDGIYPNPVNNVLHFGNQELRRVEIYNTNGVLVKSQNNSKSIELSDLPRGIYFVQLFDELTVRTEKLVKN